MASRMSNDGIVVGVSEIGLPPVVIEVMLSDGTSIALRGTKWDGSECELLDVVLPPPFSAHLFKSPVFFTGSFVDLAAALADLTDRTRHTSPVSKTPVFPVNCHSDSESIDEKYNQTTVDDDIANDVEYEDLVEMEQMSCDGESSDDEDDDDAHIDRESVPLEFE